MKKLLLTAALFTVILQMLAQSNPAVSYENNLGAWYMLFTQNRVSDKLSIHAEAQHRLHFIANNKQQLLLRTALNYHYSDHVMVSAGYGNIHSWSYWRDDLTPGIQDRTVSLENRIYQQLVLKQKVGKWSFSHRYRLEQRWVTNGGSTNYSNRARYFFLVNIPIKTFDEAKKQQLFYTFYDEIFLNISENPFSQNRFFHALGYRISPEVMFRVGYLYNYIGHSPGLNYNRLQFGVWLNPDFRKKEVTEGK